MERLSHLINAAVDRGFWKPINLCVRWPFLSHLSFVDDLVLFSEASVEQVEVIKIVVDLFCASSG